MHLSTFPLVAHHDINAHSAASLSGEVRIIERPDVADSAAPSTRSIRLEEIGELLRTDLAYTLPPRCAKAGVPVDLVLDEALDVRDQLPDGPHEDFRRSQGYLLEADAETVTLTAATPLGLLHATQTLLQLLRTDTQRHRVLGVRIVDAPRMPERGQMIDVGRKYLAPQILRAEIRRMAWWKLNSLHLHLTEWNGFRIDSQACPGLASPESYSLQELRDLDAYAQLWGVTIVPELDVPGHAVHLSRFDDRLRFNSPAMDVATYPGGQAGGWMLDVTSDKTRETVKLLLDELCSVFSSEIIHIGGDELPDQDAVDDCPELAEYARTRGFSHPADVLVDFSNDLAAHLATHGRRAELWEWWDRYQTSIVPDRSIRISKWLQDHAPTHWADQGWECIGVNWDFNFATPGYSTAPGYDGPEGFEGYMPAEELYEKDNYPHGGKVLGYRMGRWMDNAEERPYQWLDFYARRGLQVISERTWSLTGDTDAVSAFERADAVGSPPDADPHSALTAVPRKEIAAVATSSEEDESFDGRAEHLVDRERHTTWTSRTTRDLDIGPHRVTLTLTTEQPIGGLDITPRLDGLTVREYHRATGAPRTVSIWSGPALDQLTHRTDATLGPDLITHRVTLAPHRARVLQLVIHSDHGNRLLAALAGLEVLVLPEFSLESFHA